MAYMLLILEPFGQRTERGVQVGEQVYAQMLRYTQALKARGVLLASDSLTSSARGVRLQIREGRRTLIDGPFSEAKEMVGGFFLLDCKSREEAIALAAECPAAEWATIEVRESGPCFDDA